MTFSGNRSSEPERVVFHLRTPSSEIVAFAVPFELRFAAGVVNTVVDGVGNVGGFGLDVVVLLTEGIGVGVGLASESGTLLRMKVAVRESLRIVYMMPPKAAPTISELLSVVFNLRYKMLKVTLTAVCCTLKKKGQKKSIN